MVEVGEDGPIQEGPNPDDWPREGSLESVVAWAKRMGQDVERARTRWWELEARCRAREIQVLQEEIDELRKATQDQNGGFEPSRHETPDGPVVRSGSDHGVHAECVIEYPPGDPLVWRDPGRVNGHPCVYRSRLPIDTPLEALAEGASMGEIEESWPSAMPEVMRRLLELSIHLISGMAQYHAAPRDPGGRSANPAADVSAE